MPEGDTIHHAAHRMRPVLEGRVPDELATPHPRFGADRWPEKLAGRAVEARRRPRQAPVPALRGRARHPLAPAHDRRVGRLSRRPALGPLGAPRLARAARRRARGRAVRRPGARAHDRVARALRPALAGLGPDILAPRARRGPLPGAPARRRPDAADRRRPARPAHDRGHRQPVEVRGLLRRRDRSVAPDGRGLRRRGAARRAPHAAAHAAVRARAATRSAAPAIYGRVGRPCPRCGTPIRARGQGDDNRTTYWCPGCQH